MPNGERKIPGMEKTQGLVEKGKNIRPEEKGRKSKKNDLPLMPLERRGQHGGDPAIDLGRRGLKEEKHESRRDCCPGTKVSHKHIKGGALVKYVNCAPVGEKEKRHKKHSDKGRERTGRSIYRASQMEILREGT